MNLKETGLFIKDCRKAKNLTQLELAENLSVSEKTISKWECGNGFPDASLLLPLCKALDITANELLSAKKLSEKTYVENAETNLIELKRQQEKSTKNLLKLEYVIGTISSISLLILVFVASFIEMNTAIRIVLISLGFVIFVVGVLFAIFIEKEAGYYECNVCHNRYIPSYASVLFSMHYGRTRYLKCPKCHKKSWNKKTLDEPDEK